MNELNKHGCEHCRSRHNHRYVTNMLISAGLGTGERLIRCDSCGFEWNVRFFDDGKGLCVTFTPAKAAVLQ